MMSKLCGMTDEEWESLEYFFCIWMISTVFFMLWEYGGIEACMEQGYVSFGSGALIFGPMILYVCFFVVGGYSVVCDLQEMRLKYHLRTVKRRHKFHMHIRMAQKEIRRIMRTLRIENEGAEILSTNYWDASLNDEGIVVCSQSAGVLRLLIPDVHRDMIPEMQTCKEVIVSRGQGLGHQIGYEFLFEDGSGVPFAFSIGEIQMVPFRVSDAENGKPIQVSVWTRGPKKEFEMRGRFWTVENLLYPGLWGEEDRTEEPPRNR